LNTAPRLSHDPLELQQMIMQLQAAYQTQKEAHQTELAAYTAQFTTYQTQIEAYQAQITRLKEQLRLAAANRYGRSSEKYVQENDSQGRLFDEAELAGCQEETEEAVTVQQVAGHTRTVKRGKRTVLPAYLPRIRMEHTLPEAELTGPEGEVFVKIGEVVSEQLDIIPAQVQVLQQVRFKYAVKGREELGVKIAPLPGRVLGKSMASAGLLAHVATSKYCHHLPFYRQEYIWSSLDVHLPRNSLCRWMMQVGEALQPLIDYQFEEMKQHGHLHVDETPVTVLDEKDKEPDKASHQGYMWVYTNPLGVLFDYQSNRCGEHPQSLLAEFKGYVQSDAYAGYHGLFEDGTKQSVGCMAHARRKFTDVQKAAGKKKQSPVADTVVKLIAKLYKLEAKAKDEALSEQALYELRQREAIPILDTLKAFLLEKYPKTPPQGLLGKAISYMLNQWEALYRYTEAGILCIDNNPAEQKIRPFAIGRKNWLFHGNTRGAKAAAHLYSLIESAKLYNLKVFDYLKYVFENLPQATTPRKLEQLLPVYAHTHLPKMPTKAT
jgi:transposase